MGDIEGLQDYIDEGLVVSNDHDTLPLTIYNYAREVMYNQLWDGDIHKVRALVMDDDGNIVGRGMERPFNMGYYDYVPNIEYQCYEKYDGSLILLFMYNGEPIVCSKGSFHSEQSEVARELMGDNIPELEDGSTYLFEVIYPENKIVVDYGEEKTLKFLGIVDNKGGYLTPPQTEFMGFDYPEYDTYTRDELIEYQQQPYDNDEGFIVRSGSWFFKVKKNEYVDIHKNVSGLSSWHIWKALKEGDDINIENFPDEFDGWIKNKIMMFSYLFLEHENKAKNLYEEIKDLPTRKEQALAVKDSDYSGYIFAKLDGKENDEHIWNIIEPSDKTDRISSL